VSPAGVTPFHGRTATMSYMGTAGDRGGGWPDRGRRFAASPRAPAVAGALLGIAAMTEAVARGAGSGMSAVGLVGVCALAASTTVPLAFLGPVAAAVAICAASVLSLAAFQTLTGAGLAAVLIVLYRLGRIGTARSSNRRNEAPWDAAQFLAPALAVPFLVLALAGPVATGRAGSEEGVLVVLLAALAPAAALTGIAQRARSEALVHRTARQAIAGTLVEHTARGERARIARELHDVVAHHISMIAVQAETARLATPGMPAAGAQRLLEIGDTARAGLTEMRRLLGVLREDAQAADPSRVCGSSTSCSTRPGMRQAQAPGSSFPGHRPPSIPVSSWPPTASSRKRSPTPGGTRRAPRSTWSCTSPMTPWACAFATTAQARPRRSLWPPGGTGCPGCASVPRRPAASCAPAPLPAAAS
jgi:hypothetical protein